LNGYESSASTVAEFDTGGLFSGAILDITGFELTLTQSNAYFTKDGAVAFFITEDTATEIGPGSSMVWDSGDTLYGVGSQLDPKTAAGTGAFTEVADGHEDTYDLAADLSTAVKTYLITQINSGNPVCVIVAPNDGDVAATWAGYSNFDYDGPKLTVVATMGPVARIYLPTMAQNFGPPSPSYSWTGQVTNQFFNCGLTRVFGFTLARNGGLAGDRWIHYWADGWNGAWAMSQWTAFGTDTPWTGDEGNWDGVIDNRPRPGVWHVCVVPEEGSWDCLSNTVDVTTSSDCQNGYQVYHITFQEN
jgi:hypothetical protein